MAAAYIYNIAEAKFNHATAIGSKTNIPNCQVKTADGFSNETIQIFTVDQGLKIVEATTQLGAMYGLGFIHGMDRLWQLEFFRRLSAGTLSEVFGSETLAIDKYIRTIGIPRMAKNFMATATQEDLLILENYAAGINKVVEQIQVYPLEFYIFWTDFKPYTAQDAILCQYTLMMCIESDWFYEMTRERLLEIYPKEKVDQLLPFNPENLFEFQNQITIDDADLDSSLKHNGSLYTVDESLIVSQVKREKLEFKSQKSDGSYFKYSAFTSGQGSNCWAVAGQFTKSGQPMLSCDPHLNKAMNSVWYMTRLRWNQTGSDGQLTRMYMAGASLVGAPSMTHGRTPYVAWGCTAINPDVTDLYIEQIADDKYLSSNQEWKPIIQQEETIQIRFGSDYKLVNRFTRNGVIIQSDLIDGSAHDLMPWISKDQLNNPQVDGVSSVYTIANVYDPMMVQDTKPDFNFALMYDITTRNITAMEFVDSIRHDYRMVSNVVFVTANGDIGYVTAGKFPIRKYNVGQGAYTKIGHMDDNQWLGIVPASEHPYLINPTKGYIVSANNMITSSNVKHGISHSFIFQHRISRISELIEEKIKKGKLDIYQMKAIQLDVLDIQARASLSDMLSCVHKEIPEIQLFKTWDFKFSADSSAASLFTAWENKMAYYLHETKIDSADVRLSLQNHPSYLSSFYLQVQKWAQEEATNDPMCHVLALGQNTCQEFMAYTLEKAVAELKEKFGSYRDNNWKLGDYQFTRYLHNPLSEVPLIRYLFEVSTPYPGNRRTIDLACSFQNVPEHMKTQVLAGSVFRMTSDMGDEGKVEMVMDMGPEMTNPFTGFTTQFNDLWTMGRSIRLPLTELPEQVRYKMREERDPVWLFPNAEGVVIKEKKGGCPLGFTSGSKPAGVKWPQPSQQEQNSPDL